MSSPETESRFAPCSSPSMIYGYLPHQSVWMAQKKKPYAMAASSITTIRTAQDLHNY
jgi:hypothetical protein